MVRTYQVYSTIYFYEHQTWTRHLQDHNIFDEIKNTGRITQGLSWAGAGGAARGWTVEGPIIFSCNWPRLGPAHQVFLGALRPGPAHQIFKGHATAGPEPSFSLTMGRGLARPIKFLEAGRSPARPGMFSGNGLHPIPAHRILNHIGPARPGLSIFQLCRPGPIRPMTFAARIIRHGLAHVLPRTIKSVPTDVFLYIRIDYYWRIVSPGISLDIFLYRFVAVLL